MLKKSLFLAFVFAVALSFYGCAPKTPKEFDNDKDLFEYGMRLYNDGSYTEAVSFFETLKNKYPTSPYIVDAEFKLAESYFKKGDWIEAVYAFHNFRSLHPTNSQVPQAMYMSAVSYFKQIPGSIDRDQTNTINCINSIEDLMGKYPSFEDKPKALDLLSKCKRMLAKRELYIANFYLKQNSYSAALGRLETIKNNYDFKDLKEEALYKLAYSYNELQNKEKTIESLNELMALQPDGKFRKKADQLMAKIETKGNK